MTDGAGDGNGGTGGTGGGTPADAGGTTGDAGGTAGDTGGGGGPDDPDAPTCEEYCDLVMEVCTEDNKQYANKIACVAYCEDWAGIPPGTADDTDANTIGCRMYHATVAAASEPEYHCFHAGPSGVGHCGTLCQVYCQLSQRNCTGDQQLWPNTLDCINGCDAWADGWADDETGNTKECRIHYLGLAGTEPPESAEAHCKKAAADGGGVCVDAQCTPTCAAGAQCGDDGCGGTCGTCANGMLCKEDQCVADCTPNCDTGAQCGDDGCGGSCGSCADGMTCEGDQCVAACTPTCAAGAQCGDDGCGGSCGTCANGMSCKEDQCVAECTPACPPTAQCGPDGCGGTCGTCDEGLSCVSKKCVEECTPSCAAGVECGPDGCGGSCGECATGLQCYQGLCNTTCEPKCEATAQCGPDGCGGTCGTCGEGKVCDATWQCVDAGCGAITYEGCCDGVTVKYCENGELKTQACGQNECGWNAMNSYYACGNGGEKDPSGDHPIECPAP